ncbi:MAG: hypothetical protein GXO79_06675 [Chlorobi bacterium]|nr:hypothetical protein [Chlorobiota bacterium]
MISYQDVLSIIQNAVLYKKVKSPIVVGIDGPDCSGKSTMSIDLLMFFKQNYNVQIFHCDDYINRIAKDFDVNSCSYIKFYTDFFDRESIINGVFKPLNQIKDCSLNLIDIVIIEGLFLAIDEFTNFFDLFIRIEINDNEVLKRAIQRDVGKLGDFSWVKKHYINQCIPAQNHYRNKCKITSNSDYIFKLVEPNQYEIQKGHIYKTK